MFQCAGYQKELTVYDFASEPAVRPANDEDLVGTLHHHSCMVFPLVAGNGVDMKCKAIRYLIRPQCCVVSPFVLATAPRDAISPGRKEPTTSH